MEHETDMGTAYRVNWDHLGIWQMQTIDSATNGNQGGGKTAAVRPAYRASATAAVVFSSEPMSW
jgi:hypothetical protein